MEHNSEGVCWIHVSYAKRPRHLINDNYIQQTKAWEERHNWKKSGYREVVFGDDIVIVSDPYDTSDHKQDGYGIMNAERFYEMWFEGDSTSDGQKKRQQWVVAYPK